MQSGLLGSLFADRIEGLPADARHLILLAAIADTTDLRRLYDAFPGSLPDALDPAEQSGVLRAGNGRIEFVDPLVRSAALELSTVQERRIAHRLVAEAFSDQPYRQAWHLAEAADGPDEDLAKRLEEIAFSTARRGDARAAIEAMAKAAELSAIREEQNRRLTSAALLEAETTGDTASVIRLLQAAGQIDDAVPGCPEAATARALLTLSEAGDLVEAHRTLVAVLESPEYLVSDHVLSEALWTLALISTVSGNADMWAEFTRMLERHRRRAPQWILLAGALCEAPEQLPGCTDEAIDVVCAPGDPAAVARFAFLVAETGRASRLRAALRRASEAAWQAGDTATAIYALIGRARLAWDSGDWDECERLGGQALALCDEHRHRPAAWPVYSILAQLAAARGDRSKLRSLTGQLPGWPDSPGESRLADLACHALALEALGSTRYLDAGRLAGRVLAADGSSRSCVSWLGRAAGLMEAAVRGGDTVRARALARTLARIDPSGLSPQLALLIRGALALEADSGKAGALFEAALSADGATRAPFDWARVCLAYGEHLRQLRATGRAVERLRQALAIFQALGAQPWAARTAAELRACGEPVRVAGRPRPELLTAQERRIAEMAAAGRSNPEIACVLNLTASTVGNHLLRAYRKLGVNSRAAIRDALGYQAQTYDPPTSLAADRASRSSAREVTPSFGNAR